MTETTPGTPVPQLPEEPPSVPDVPAPLPVVLDDQQLNQLAFSVAAELASYLGVPTTVPAVPGLPVAASADGPKAPAPEGPPAEPGAGQPADAVLIPLASVQESAA
ncbi:hypothetical protein ACIQRZ_04510 [Streptomyces rubiginosohelvolus]|uniref:hypothetical protein n=1 Tax=Streptomyces rubiginosohelvolus TaxID=67362 RepID=UPI00381BDD83